AQKAIGARLQPLPQWAAEALDLVAEGDEGAEQLVLEHRIALAVATLVSLGLARIDTPGNRYELAATDAGRAWLARPDSERIKGLIAPVRKSPHRFPESWYSATPATEFFPIRLDVSLRDATLDLRAALTEAFLSIPPGAMVKLGDFLEHHARAANPFPTVKPSGSRGSYAVMPREQREAVWERILSSFLQIRMAPFGGAPLGRTAEGDVAFGVAGPGRYLLGAVDDFEFAPPVEGDVVVQPDFEVVFLAPSPRLEPEIARFSERTGAGVGALFRITRASVLRGAEGGLAADAMIATLERIARGGVPANVTRQLRDWVGGTRRVQIRPAVLITCPDPETAARVRTLGGKNVEELTPTVLALRAKPAEHKALLKRLRERGIFVTESP
ncbi:MAG TPA: helicase-associated domain-containing protein, partial [Longimicrobium sp.]